LNQLASALKQLLKRYIPAAYRLRLRPLVATRCARGSGSFIHSSVQMLGAGNITIGNNSCVSEHTWFNVNHRNKGEVAISIGDCCFIGRRNFVSSGKRVSIGHYALTTNDCRFICSSHITDDPLVPYIASGTTSADQIEVGVNCFFGSGAVVIGNVTIGHGSVIGASTVVTKHIPPFSIVVGNPARIVRRYSFAKTTWLDADTVTETDLQENPDEAHYLALIRNTYPHIAMPLMAAGADFGNV
jgi:acetyltransferase-like isoleucine patch superfamily enzyme